MSIRKIHFDFATKNYKKYILAYTGLGDLNQKTLLAHLKVFIGESLTKRLNVNHVIDTVTGNYINQDMYCRCSNCFKEFKAKQVEFFDDIYAVCPFCDFVSIFCEINNPHFDNIVFLELIKNSSRDFHIKCCNKRNEIPDRENIQKATFVHCVNCKIDFKPSEIIKFKKTATCLNINDVIDADIGTCPKCDHRSLCTDMVLKKYF